MASVCYLRKPRPKLYRLRYYPKRKPPRKPRKKFFKKKIKKNQKKMFVLLLQAVKHLQRCISSGTGTITHVNIILRFIAAKSDASTIQARGTVAVTVAVAVSALSPSLPSLHKHKIESIHIFLDIFSARE